MVHYLSFVTAVMALVAGVDAANLRVAETPGAASSPTMYGIMFEVRMSR